MSKQTYRVCFCFSRKFKLTAAEAPDEIKSLFDRYSEDGTMTVDHLHRFLIEVQGESDATLEDAQSILDQSAKHYSLTNTKAHLFHRHKDGLSLEAFFRYLFAPTNSPLSPSQTVVYQDMNAPLSHYFIYTGHNSYLTGNQLSSDCSDVPIIKALQKGVRVIELDMWPNSTKDDIDILHGRTLTSPVQLITCLRSIKKHAFDASEYPVILTLEDHLPPSLQAKVAQMVHETFGEMLFIPPGTETEFPSPESLKRRVIISTKPPKEYLSHTATTKKNSISKSKKDTDKADSSVKQTNDSEDVWGNEVQYMGDQGNEQEVEQEEEDDGDIDYDGLERITTGESEYKKLIGIHAKKRKGEFKEWFMCDPKAPPKRLSLSEQVLAKAITTHHSHILRFTEKNLLRVFPKTTRFDSSNYNPLIGWIHGAQMVAFNMQGYGRSLWLMHGMFRGNGGCGYVKKPDFLLGETHQQKLFDPKLTLPLKTTLKVKVYMGEGWYYDFRHTHFDAYSPPDFYARVGIAGVAADSVMKKTATIEDDWTPTWNQEFEFPLSVPELALLRIEVHEYDMSEKDDFAGQVCLPVSELRSGIRVVSLNDRKGEKYNSVKLLMHFTFV